MITSCAMAPQDPLAVGSIADAFLSIDAYLNPRLLDPALLARVGSALRAGGLVVIRDAFQPVFAQRMHAALDGCMAWKVHEKFDEHFHYHHHNLYDLEDFPEDLRWCRQVFDSPSTRQFAERISGRACPGNLAFSASWYLPGDHSLPHTDAIAHAAEHNRQVAFVWHLSRDWRSEWGGALFWCPTSLYIAPEFNTLVLFNVGPDTHHFVTTVSPYAQGKRLTINGWWTGPGATGDLRERAIARLDGVEIY